MSVLSSFCLDGKVAIVTGAKRGLGKAIALAFAEAGADVAVCTRDITDGRLETTAKEVRKFGRRSLAVQADVDKPLEFRELAHYEVRHHMGYAYRFRATHKEYEFLWRLCFCLQG